ncbi:hypothetical protein D9M70_475120 [compost metagenome]
MAGDAQDIPEEAFLGEVKAKQLRHLVEHDDEADAGLEADQDRRGDEVGDEAEAEKRSQDEKPTGHRRQRRGCRHQLAGIAIRDGKAELCSGENGKGRGRRDAQHPGRAEKRVDDHRHEGGVETDTDRQTGDRGIGHRLWQNHGSGRETCNHVEPETRSGTATVADRRMLVRCHPDYPLAGAFMKLF